MLWLLTQNNCLRDTKTATVLETAKEIAVQASEFGLNFYVAYYDLFLSTFNDCDKQDCFMQC